jgi:hypothetical protein
MQAKLGPQRKNLIGTYCLYPDIYGGLKIRSKQRAAMRVHCEKPDGEPIHNVTWRKDADFASLEYVLRGMLEGLRSGNIPAAAQYAGVLAHFLEDSTCPAHAFIPMDECLIL